MTPKKKGSRKWLIPVVLAALVAIIAFGVIGAHSNKDGNASSASQPTAISGKTQEALSDALEVAEEMASMYENLANSEEGNVMPLLDKSEERLARIQKDMKSFESNGADSTSDRAFVAMKNLEALLDFDIKMAKASELGSKEFDDAENPTMQETLRGLEVMYNEYSAIEPPSFLEAYLQKSMHAMKILYQAAGSLIPTGQNSKTPVLGAWQAKDLLNWSEQKGKTWDKTRFSISAQQCKASMEAFQEQTEGTSPTSGLVVEAESISDIYPNLYHSLDSLVNLYVTAADGAQSITVKADIPGFTQSFSQKYDLPQGADFIMVKPSLLVGKDMPDLTHGWETQLNLTVVDNNTKENVIEKSYPIKVNSIHDFNWTDSQFGTTAAFDILAWMRPQAEEVNAVNEAAGRVLSTWGTDVSTLSGYQYGNNSVATLMQVAAIQMAISQGAHVQYQMNNYSFSSEQNILMPNEVVNQRHGLCIETSLLMASCLLNAGMHPLLIIPPGHAQVAVETYEGSGQYFLIETTVGDKWTVNTKYKTDEAEFYNGLLHLDSNGKAYTTSGNDDDWTRYFKEVGNFNADEYGDIVVIDCRLQSLLDIQGLENL